MVQSSRQCRACMLLPPFLISLQDVTERGFTITEMLQTVVPQLSITRDDQLPALICSACLNKLKIAYNFQQMCIESEQQLYRAHKNSTDGTLTVPQELVEVEMLHDNDVHNSEESKIDDLLKKDLERHENYDEELVAFEPEQEPTDESIANVDVLAETDVACDESSQQTGCDVSDVPAQKNNKTLKARKTTRNRAKNLQCTNCKEAFKTMRQYLNHVKQHASDLETIVKQQQEASATTHVCDQCDKVFTQKSSLNAHLLIHTGASPFLCPHCGKLFNNKSNLRQHMLRHSNERAYECPKCGAKFHCLSDQIKHMSTHNAVKPHVCETCGSSFSRSYTLAKHRFIHTGKRPHKCEECGMTFVFIDHLRRHMRKHTGEKPYKCSQCDRAYAESGDLTKHLRKHVGEKTYKCEKCPAAFKYQTELREHNIEHYNANLKETTYEISEVQ